VHGCKNASSEIHVQGRGFGPASPPEGFTLKIAKNAKEKGAWEGMCRFGGFEDWWLGVKSKNDSRKKPLPAALGRMRIFICLGALELSARLDEYDYSGTMILSICRLQRQRLMPILMVGEYRPLQTPGWIV